MKKSDYKWICLIFGFVFIVVALILAVLFLMKGSKTFTDDGVDYSMVESITCSNEEMIYPFFKYDNAKTRTIKINMILENNKMDKISLIVNLYYDDVKQIEHSSVENHAAMEQYFYEDSMNASAFDINFSSLDDAVQMVLNARAKDLNGINAKYFLIESVAGYTKETLIKNYNNQGFSCVIKEKE